MVKQYFRTLYDTEIVSLVVSFTRHELRCITPDLNYSISLQLGCFDPHELQCCTTRGYTVLSLLSYIGVILKFELPLFCFS